MALSRSCRETESDLDQVLVARGRQSGQAEIGLRRHQVGAGLGKLLVNFRRIDLGKDFALLDVAADVLVPLLEVTVGSRIDRRLDIGLEGPRKHHFGIGIDGCGVNHRDVRNGHLFGLLRERLVFGHALRDGINSQNQKNKK